MNSKAFALFFASVAVLVGVGHAFGTFETVTNGAIISLPLLATTTGSLALPLAVLGALKLGAAALLALTLLKPQEEESYAHETSDGYGHFFRQRRHRRDAGMEKTSDEGIFKLVSALDTYGCGKQLICELETANPESLAADEKLLLTFFGGKAQKNPASAKAEYELAAELGFVSKNTLLCRARYVNCPFTGPQMMEALRESEI